MAESWSAYSWVGNLTEVWMEEPCTTFLSCDFGKWYAHPPSQVDGGKGRNGGLACANHAC